MVQAVNHDPELKTTGELRAFLVKSLQEVRLGKLDIERASRMAKLAAQINENFYAEIKINKMRVDVGEKMEKLGTLSIGA